MVWSLGRSFGSRKGSIEGEAMLTFKTTWKHKEKTNSNKKSNNAKVFVKPHFIMIYHLKCCAMKIRVWQHMSHHSPYLRLECSLGIGRDLLRMTWPSSSCLLQNTHLVPLMLWLLSGFSTNVHTWFLSKLCSSSCIVFIQSGSSNASSTFIGSMLEMNE